MSPHRRLGAPLRSYALLPFHAPRAALALCALVAAAAPPSATPCGPFFPTRLLEGKNELALEAPVGELANELRLAAQRSGFGKPPFKANEEPGAPLEKAVQADVDELRDALKRTPLAEPLRAQVQSGYERARQAYLRYAGPTRDYAREAQRTKAPPPAWLPDLDPPEHTPAEFADYLRGAKAYYLGRIDTARGAWKKVVERPLDERRHRAVWAAFMLGRTAPRPERKLYWFKRVRAFAREGCVDRLGLAAESLGEEGRVHLETDDFLRALQAYTKQQATGARGAAASVRTTLRRAFAAAAPAPVLQAMAKDTLARRAVLAFIVSKGGPLQASGLPPQQKLAAFLSALEATAARDVDGADRVAWATYQQGDFAAAKRWALRAPDSAPIAQWLLAKLALREGHFDEAARLLRRATALLPTAERWADVADPKRSNGYGVDTSPLRIAMGDLGGVELVRREFTLALDAFMRAQSWWDAAYVAERVLTLDELKTYVDQNVPETKPPAAGTAGTAVAPKPTGPAQQHAPNLRALLGRRLHRAGRLDEAAPYLEAAHRDAFARYLAHRRDATAPARDAQGRARSLFEAAFLLRVSGLELYGAELEPDYALYGANFLDVAPSRERSVVVPGRVLPPSDEERTRLSRHPILPDKRYHYRHVAAQLAWEAAHVFPPDTPEAATMLCRAGTWLKFRDPKAADRFYKALATRHAKTPLGKSAAARRWFPADCR